MYFVQYFGWKGTKGETKKWKKSDDFDYSHCLFIHCCRYSKAKRYVSRSGCSISKSMKPDHVLWLLKFDILNSQFRVLFLSNSAKCHSTKCALCYRWWWLLLLCCSHRLCRHIRKFHLILNVFIILQSDKLLFRRLSFFGFSPHFLLLLVFFAPLIQCFYPLVVTHCSSAVFATKIYIYVIPKIALY